MMERKAIKLYQAKVFDLSDIEAQIAQAKELNIKITGDQAWALLVDRVKKALLRDIEKHIEFRMMNNPDGTILTEALIWIEVPEPKEGGA